MLTIIILLKNLKNYFIAFSEICITKIMILDPQNISNKAVTYFWLWSTQQEIAFSAEST